LAYLAWVAGSRLNPHVNAIDGYISEFAARGEPYSWLFRTGDFITGSPACRPPPRRCCSRSTAPKSDAECACREHIGAVSFAHQAHTVTSAWATAGVVVGLVALILGGSRLAAAILGIQVAAGSALQPRCGPECISA
jgi:hypothetical protein